MVVNSSKDHGMLQTREPKALSFVLNPLRKDSGTAILFVLVVAVILSMMIGGVIFTSRYSVQKSGVRREKVASLNIAEAGKERFYTKLRHENYNPSPNSDVTIFDNESFGGGLYTVRCVTGADPTMMAIWAQGKKEGNSIMLEIHASKKQNIPVEGLAARLSGAVIARSSIDLGGGYTADGREHDSTGVVNPADNGTFGVYTMRTLDVSGSSEVGGNGFAPVGKKDYEDYENIVYRENAPLDSTYPYPEAVFGLAEGLLDTFAKPVSAYSYPFTGLVYVNGDFGPSDKLGGCSGIFIAHNSSRNATIKINANGTFKGLIICDRLDKMNGNLKVIGAIVILDTSATSSYCCNGGAEVLYSKQVLNNLASYCSEIKYVVDQLSWREVN